MSKQLNNVEQELKDLEAKKEALLLKQKEAQKFKEFEDSLLTFGKSLINKAIKEVRYNDCGDLHASFYKINNVNLTEEQSRYNNSVTSYFLNFSTEYLNFALDNIYSVGGGHYDRRWSDPYYNKYGGTDTFKLNKEIRHTASSKALMYIKLGRKKNSYTNETRSTNHIYNFGIDYTLSLEFNFQVNSNIKKKIELPYNYKEIELEEFEHAKYVAIQNHLFINENMKYLYDKTKFVHITSNPKDIKTSTERLDKIESWLNKFPDPKSIPRNILHRLLETEP